MKTFYKSSELPHLWAHGLATQARCPSAESIEGDAYMSYNTVIGRRYEHKGARCFLVNDTSYSATTSKHQSAMRLAIPSDALEFHIGNLTMGERMDFGTHKQTGARVFEYAMEQAAESALKAEKARKQDSKDFHAGRQSEWLESARKASEFFGLRRKVDESTIGRLKASKVRAELAQKKADALREKVRIAKDADDIRDWLMGKSVYLSHALPCYLRTERPVDADPARSCVLEIITSKGARISYDAGKRTFEFAMKARAKGWHQNGSTFAIDSYHLSAVNEQGIIAGCHRISWSEIERFAKQEGWTVPA